MKRTVAVRTRVIKYQRDHSIENSFVVSKVQEQGLRDSLHQEFT